MAGALLLASCGKDKSTPAPAPAPEPAGPVDLSEKGTANCYIVSAPGTYSFKTTKGNSSVAVSVAAAEVLWESFGTETKPEVGDIIKSVSYADNRITFTTPATLKNGNALIVAKDESNQISWSWHIWVCEGYDPVAQGQVYNNEAGTMMDRNLGATSAEPGEVGAIGLMYQWGRKDPILGAARIGYNVRAVSTLIWPASVTTDASCGTVAYAIQHPTTFIYGVSSSYDWVFAGDENELWTAEKSIYDPCPVGWKVPAGGATDGVWYKATKKNVEFDCEWDDVNKGVKFSGILGDDPSIWYPATGRLYVGNGYLQEVGKEAGYWSSTANGAHSYVLTLNSNGIVGPCNSGMRSCGRSVRCCKVVK